MITADGLFRRFQNGEISVSEMLNQAEKLPSKEFQRLVELMLKQAYPPNGEEGGKPPRVD